MRPLLVLVADSAEHPVATVRARLVEHFGLTPEELAEELPSGRAKTFAIATRYDLKTIDHDYLVADEDGAG
jgi:restriction endonuclease Mrr